MKRLAAVFLLFASIFQVSIIERPAWILWGNPEGIEFDPSFNVYINHNTRSEMWRHQEADPEKRAELLAPEHIPVKKTVKIGLKKLVFINQERYIFLALGASQVLDKRRFVLINVEQTLNERLGADDKQYRVWPHLGLISVGTVAYEEGWEVVLWDELVAGYAPIEELIHRGDILGLSLVATGIERGIDMAHRAKSLGARYIIAGNDSAIFRANQILSLPGKPIDAVFTSNDIAAIRGFFRQIDTAGFDHINIPGVQTMPGQLVRSNERKYLLRELLERKQARTKADVFIVPRIELYPHWSEVWANYRKTFGHKHSNPNTVKNAISLLAQGCTRTRGTDVCSYCSIADVADINMPSRDYLAHTFEAYESFGVDMVYNATDSIYEMRSVARVLQELGISWPAMTIYGRSQGVAQNPRLLEEWQKIATERLLVNIGMDSGNEQILQRGVTKSSTIHGSRLEENRQAVRSIRKAGAHLHYSLIFGSPGETRKTCEESIVFLEWTTEELGDQLDICETDIYWLTYGAPVARIFSDYGYAQELSAIARKTISRDEWGRGFATHADKLVVPRQVEEAWYRHFTDIDLDVANEFNDRAATIMERHTGSIRGRAFRPDST
ncbi:hypothetical protein HYV44_01930 [Candidatus Microgenomates bacterium]|nr:hypothetical protein [Candidatus Microgenomates bacterium]